MPWASIADLCSALSRIASRPPCTEGCSVFTRPSIISGNPVTSETSSTSSPASASVLRVPPVEISVTPCSANARANSTRPALSDTESSAREMRRRSSVIVPSRWWRCHAREGGHPVTPVSLIVQDAAMRFPWLLDHPLSRMMTAEASGSQRQLRLLLAVAAAAAAGRHVGESPLHARDLTGAAADNNLCCAPRSIGTGEIDAFLKLKMIVIDVEGPYLLVRQDQHGPVRIAQPVHFDGRVQVKAQRELIVIRRHEF